MPRTWVDSLDIAPERLAGARERWDAKWRARDIGRYLKLTANEVYRLALVLDWPPRKHGWPAPEVEPEAFVPAADPRDVLTVACRGCGYRVAPDPLQSVTVNGERYHRGCYPAGGEIVASRGRSGGVRGIGGGATERTGGTRAA